MNSLLIILIAILFWIVGFFIYDLGAISHILLGVVLMIIALNFFQGRKLRGKLRGKLF